MAPIRPFPAFQEFAEFVKKYVPDVNPRSRNAALAYLHASILAKIIEQCGDDLKSGAMVTGTESSVRVRRLPLVGS